MQGEHCLIPISVSGNRFSTNNFLVALRAIDKPYARATFLVADALQRYNRAAAAKSSDGIRDILNAPDRIRYLDERKIWLGRMQTELGAVPIASAVWDIKGIDELASSELASIHRSLLILFAVDARFRTFVIRDAQRHLDGECGPEITDARLELSQLYLLEEMAINIYLHCVKGIGDEYYLDGVIPGLRALYDSELAVSAFDLVGCLGMPLKQSNFSFYSFDDRSLKWMI